MKIDVDVFNRVVDQEIQSGRQAALLRRRVYRQRQVIGRHMHEPSGDA